MGSPVSVVVAEIVMQRLEERALSSYPNPPPFWFRYVDDTLMSVSKHQKNDFLDHLNKQNPSLQFTMEPEKDGKIAFLDCIMTRDSNSLRTSVYRKPTSTSRLLDNSSYHPTSHKLATIATFSEERAHAVCSSSETLEDELQHLDKAFTINKYSKPFVNSVCLGQVINVTAIDTQGGKGPSELQWVTSYKISYTVKNDNDYIAYIENGGVAKVIYRIHWQLRRRLDCSKHI
ncbi:Hypothetical predicted protein [Paramuricea clavata]|uniref:Helix-turn-helix domain-containing protein n=1 Tax=Paramuricea clavata TaxID=317549 RepID=A0A7D9DBX0_PARCT|nr:Hypothetical predicted protein [Paramuricea clavata]